VALRVEDDGEGMSEELLARVFDPFFTTKGTQGTGLGLSIAYSVMRRLGGSISAANRPEGGAVFTLTFPVAAPVERAEPPRPAPAAAPRDRHVMVVDDDDDNLEATRWVLEGLGQRVSAARSGAEALALLAEGGPVDLVLCDIGMPGLDGWEVAERIQQIRPGTRTFLISGWASEIAPDDPRLRSVRGVLPKPLDLDRLERLLGAELSAAAPVPPAGAAEASPAP
jgi:CheY-like chemotaxis protein